MGGKMRLIIATAPGDIAPELARTLVEGRLAACVNIVQKVRSIYYWKGKIEDDQEALLLFKTTSEKVDSLTKRLKELHPYDVPEIISVEIQKGEGNSDYLDWVGEVLG
jgi:periplasmic divalent cation tolerance protein